MLCSGSPWAPRRIGHKVLDEIASKVLRTYWSVASFQALYARANDWTVGAGGRTPTVLDRWALSEAHRLVAEVDAALEDFDTAAGRTGAGRPTSTTCPTGTCAGRGGGSGTATRPRCRTLHECLHVLTRLLAPFVPFVTEKVWSALFATTGELAPDSVHLAQWPIADPTGRRRAARRAGGAGAPPGRARPLGPRRREDQDPAAAGAGADLGAGLEQPARGAARRRSRDELNVVELARLSDTGELVELTVKPNFRELGKVYGKRTQHVATAIAAAAAARRRRVRRALPRRAR